MSDGTNIDITIKAAVGQATAALEKLSNSLGHVDDKAEGAGKEAQETGEKIDKVGDKSKKAATGGLESLAKKLVIVYAAFAGLKKVVAGVMESLARTDAATKQAEQLNITADSLRGLQLSAELAGVGVDMVGMVLGGLTGKLQAASAAGNPVGLMLQQIGLSAAELGRMAPDKALGTLGAALAQVEDPALRARIAMGLMSEQGYKLLPMLAGGTDGLAKMEAEAKRLGGGLTDLDRAGVAKALDSFTAFQQSISGTVDVMVAKLAPSLAAIGTAFTEIAVRLSGTGEQGQAVGAVLVGVAQVLATLGHGLAIIWAGMQAGVVAVASVAAKALGGIIGILQTVGIRAEGLGELLGMIWDTPSQKWSLLWAGMLNVTVQAVAEITQALVMLGKNASIALGTVSETVNREMTTKLVELEFATYRWAASASSAFNDVKKAAEVEMPGVSDAMDKAFGDITLPEDTTLGKWRTGLQTTGDTLGAELPDLLQNIQDTALVFGGQTAATFVQGFVDKMNVDMSQVGLPGAASADAAPMNPEEDQRVIYEADIAQRITAIKEAERNADMDAEAQRRNFYASSMQNRLSVTSGILGNLSTLMNSHSKKAFAIGKAAAIGQAVIDTWAAANKSMASLPYPVNIAAAAATAAAGMVNVQNISRQQFGGGAAGGASGGAGGAGSANVGGPGGGEAAAPSKQTNINLSLSGNNFSQSQVRQLMAQMVEAQGDGAKLAIVGGR